VKAVLELFVASVKIRPEGKRPRTVMLPRPLAQELLDLAESGQEDELIARVAKIWTLAVKSAVGLYWCPPETNPDIPEAELAD
jgi:hypothetical protein